MNRKKHTANILYWIIRIASLIILLLAFYIWLMQLMTS
jgi:hypothetical protein